MKAIALIVVKGGVCYDFAPEHVDVRVVDQDNIEAGQEPQGLPRNVGFEALVAEADLTEGKDYVWEN